MDSRFARPWGQTRARMQPSEPKPGPQPCWLDVERERIEAGPGGDVDAGERLTRTRRGYVPGLKRTVSIWLRLHEQVQCGELGGPRDGQRQGVSVALAGGADLHLTRSAAPRQLTSGNGI